MEENKSEPKEPKQEVVTSKPVHKHWFTWLLSVLLVVSLAGNGYLWMQQQKAQDDLSAQRSSNQSLQDQIEKLQDQVGGDEAIGENEEESACTYTPSTSMKDNIKAALDSKNTAAFATYTTDPITYVLAASELGGDTTPDQAAINLEYTHSATSPWAFVPASDYSGGDYAGHFDKKAIAIKSTDGMVVAFDFNCDGSKISEIFVAASEDLL